MDVYFIDSIIFDAFNFNELGYRKSIYIYVMGVPDATNNNWRNSLGFFYCSFQFNFELHFQHAMMWNCNGKCCCLETIRRQLLFLTFSREIAGFLSVSWRFRFKFFHIYEI